MDWTRSLIAGLIALVVVAVLPALAGKAPPDRRGWRLLAPSAVHWTAIGLGVGLVGLMGYIRLFVGSDRADGESQMAVLNWLIVGFSVLTIGTALGVVALRRRAIRWRGNSVVWRRGGRELSADLRQVREIGRDFLGYTVLRFEDGQVLRVDPYARGAGELLNTVAEG